MADTGRETSVVMLVMSVRSVIVGRGQQRCRKAIRADLKPTGARRHKSGRDERTENKREREEARGPSVPAQFVETQRHSGPAAAIQLSIVATRDLQMRNFL
jgi:hypothetical protein